MRAVGAGTAGLWLTMQTANHKIYLQLFHRRRMVLLMPLPKVLHIIQLLLFYPLCLISGLSQMWKYKHPGPDVTVVLQMALHN